MADSAQEKPDFHWLTTDGQRLSGSERELRSALSSGALSAQTLVWRRGWAEWQAAQRVVELAASLPTPLERKSEPRSSKPSAAPVQMPPLVPRVPLSSARSSAPASRPSSSAQYEAARDTLAPAFAPSSFGNIGGARRPWPPEEHESGTPPPPPARARAPLPTLTEEDGVVSATATLRPPGAVPPPPRGVPTPALDASAFASENRGAALTPSPNLAAISDGPSTLPAAAPVAQLRSEPASSPRAGRAPGARPPAPNTLPSADNTALASEPAPAAFGASLDAAPGLVQRVPLETLRAPVEPQPALGPSACAAATEPELQPQRRFSEQALELGQHGVGGRHRDMLLKLGPVALHYRSALRGLLALSGALSLAVLGLLVSRSHEETPAPVASASVSGARPVPAPPTTPILPAAGCRLVLPAARLFGNVERGVPPYFAQPASESSLALGFAETKTKGVGLRLSPDTLDVSEAFEEEGKGTVRGVVPLTRSGSLTFFVDRDDSALRAAHTLDEIPPFTLGVSDAGFARVVAGSASVIWPLPANLKITEPRLAPLAGFGYGVTFRRGGQSGSVLLGFVSTDGAKKSELLEIPNAPKWLGTPVIAGSAAGALVAFAGRDTVDAPWQLFVSLSRPGAAPSPARALIAGSGGGAISPTLSAFGVDRWLLQWTEGSSGQYQVHVQTFAADLSPLGANVLVSPKGANAGQGSLSASASRVTSLFILTTAGHDELWGATLSCQ